MSVEITDISVPNVTNRKHFHSKLNNLCVHFLRAEPECQLMMKGRHMMEVHNPHMMEDSYDSTDSKLRVKRRLCTSDSRILLASGTL